MPLSEFALIAEVFAPLATSKAALRLKDDVALLAPRAGQDLVLKTDSIVEGVDFFSNDPPDTVARKALRVNLSDLAAKGAKPIGYLLTLVLPKKTPTGWVRRFAKGLASDQRRFRLSLLGGDMSSTPGPIAITIAAIGAVPKGRALLRSGARAGDLVFVTGTIGDSGGGLAALNDKRRVPYLIGRYRVPEPRLAFGQALRGRASAALDVSDGLIADLGHIAEVSNVHIAVEAARIPLSPALHKLWGKDAAVRAAVAGDDYEIAFTAPRTRRAAVFRGARKTGTAVTEIGFVMPGRGVALLGADGRPIALASSGWQHF